MCDSLLGIAQRLFILLQLAEQSRAVGELIETGPTGFREQLSKVTGKIRCQSGTGNVPSARKLVRGLSAASAVEEQSEFNNRPEFSRKSLFSVQLLCGPFPSQPLPIV